MVPGAGKFEIGGMLICYCRPKGIIVIALRFLIAGKNSLITLKWREAACLLKSVNYASRESLKQTEESSEL